MAFVTDLWESIFTPGVTPSLIVATHASFAALLITLIGLLFATHNIHFIILTVLASSLWAAITWFIKEVEANKNSQVESQGEKPDKSEVGIATSKKTPRTTRRVSRKI